MTPDPSSQAPADKQEPIVLCDCGCGRVAVFICTGFQFDPNQPECRGLPFKSPCCSTSADYLEESSHELGLLPFTRTPIAQNARLDRQEEAR
jgi:hypothetical protein